MATVDICDNDVFENGSFIALYIDGEASEMNELVDHLSKVYKIKVDWHWMGGRARVLALTDDNEIIEAMRKYLYILNVDKQEVIYFGSDFNFEM